MENEEYYVVPFLKYGEENAIKSNALVKYTNAGNIRILQQLIQHDRNNGAVICSSDAGGYFLPKNKHEIERWVKKVNNRAIHTIESSQSAIRALKKMKGQESLEVLDAE